MVFKRSAAYKAKILVKRILILFASLNKIIVLPLFPNCCESIGTLPLFPGQKTGTRICRCGHKTELWTVYHGRSLKYWSFYKCSVLLFQSFDQGEDREGGNFKLI
jgi:hypothetical protein